MKRFAILILCAFSFLANCGPVKGDNPIAEQNTGLSLDLPINYVGEQKVSLKVKISKKYQPLQPLPNKFMEFIPAGEDPYKWSEIITLQTLVGAKASASVFLNTVKKGMKATAPSFKILEENTKQGQGYEVASFGASYTAPTGQEEVVYMRYYSGPEDLAGIQYAKPLASNESSKALLKQLIDFVDKISGVASVSTYKKKYPVLTE